MKFLNKIILSFSLLFSIPAFAGSHGDELWVHRYMWSHHFKDNNYNQNHNLIGIEYKNWVIANYYNSEYRNTNLFGRYVDKCTNIGIFHTCGGIIAGVANGYSFQNNGGYAPYLVPTARLTYKRVGVEINALPQVVTCQLIFRFK